MRLPLTYIPVDATRFFHSDAYGIAKLFALFDFGQKKHERKDRIAALRVRKLAVDAHETRDDHMELDADEESILRRVLAEPENHLRETTSIDGKEVPALPQVLQELSVVAAMENLQLILEGEPPLYPAQSSHDARDTV